MHTHTRQNRFLKVFAIVVLFVTVGFCSCNNSTSTDVKKDTTATPAADTSMKMKVDTMKVDTAGKGGQAAPTGH